MTNTNTNSSTQTSGTAAADPYKKQSAELEFRKKRSETLKAIRENLSSGSEKKSGNFSVATGQKYGYMAEIVSYRAFETISQRIANSIKDKISGEKKNILILDNMDIFLSNARYQSITKGVESMNAYLVAMIKLTSGAKASEIASNQQESAQNNSDHPTFPSFNQTLPPEFVGLESALAGLANTNSIMTAISGVLGFFSTDYTAYSRDFEVDNFPVQMMVAKQLKTKTETEAEKKHEIKISTLPSDFSSSALLTNVENLTNNIRSLEAEVAKLNQIKSDLSQVENPDPVQKKQLVDIPPKISKAESALKNAAEYLNKLVADAADSPSPLTQAIFIEAILHPAWKPDYLLYLNLESKGGEIYVSKSSIFNGFKPTAYYLAGGAVSYILTDKDGKIVDSGVEVETAYRKFKFESKSLKLFKTGS